MSQHPRCVDKSLMTMTLSPKTETPDITLTVCCAGRHKTIKELKTLTLASSLIANARTFSAFLHVRITTGFLTSYSGT